MTAPEPPLRDPRWYCSVSSNLDALASLRRAATTMLQTLDVTPPQRDDILLAITELASNVVKHATPAASTLRLELNADKTCLLLMDDGGPFHGFPQGGESNPAAFLGESGMGLALVRHLFPALQYQAAHGSHWNRATLPLPQHARPRILVVDDDPLVGEVIAAFLEEHYDVRSCLSIREADTLVLNGQVDLLLCDILMPGEDGLAWRDQLSQHAASATLPFIFLTGCDSNDMRLRAAGLGVDDYLQKPVDPVRLQHTIHRVLQRHGALRDSLDHTLERAITDSLRPPIPSPLHGWQIRQLCVAASRGGGDFIFHHNSGDSWGLLLGDIMGHGTGAKFFAHAYAGFLQGLGQSLLDDLQPATLLHRLHQAAAEAPVLRDTLLTAVCVHAWPDGRLEIGSAGHPAPFELGLEQVKRVDCSGPLPGLGEPEYSFSQRQLQPGESLLLYTDGLSDLLGDDGLLQFLQHSTQLAPEQQQHALESLLQAHAPLRDDVSAVWLSYQPTARKH